MARAPALVDAPGRMHDRDQSHFFTEQGALCGARIASRWTLAVSSTTCEACRELLEARRQFDFEASARRTAPAARNPGGR